MKKIFAIIFSAFVGISAFAQVDRSTMPEPGPAPELKFGEYKVYELKNGLKVIVVEDHKLPRLSMRLLVDRDPIAEGDKAGYVSLSGDMLRQGTNKRPKDQLDQEIDFIGANLFTRSNLIYTSGLSKYSETLMEIMADVTMNPAFPEEEFEKLKKQELSNLESIKDDPEAIASRVGNALLYGKEHPYGELTTEETLNNVRLEDVQTYYNNYWVPNNSYLAIVGDIKPRKAKKLAKKYFGDWKEGNIARNAYPTPEKPSSTQVALVNKESAVQSVVGLGNTIELQPGDPDVVKLALTNQILGGGSLGRLFQNIREDKGYTYGAYSSYEEDRLVGEFAASASVRNEVTDSAISEFLHEFNLIRTKPVSEEELQGAKSYIIGSFGRSLESAQTLASYALNIERYDLGKDYYENYLKRLEEISAEDVQATAQKYITPEQMHILVVGNAAEVADKVEKFGELTYYNENADTTGAPSAPLPEGLTAEQVVNDYIQALGGKENLQKVKDVTMSYDAEIPGAPMTLKAEMVKKRPNKYKMEISMQGSVVQKMVYDGEKGMANGQEVQGEQLDAMKSSAEFNRELNYLSEDYELELVRMAQVEDEDAYVLKVTDKNGEQTTEYYSAESGLKLKEETTQETPDGPMVSSEIYSNYKEVEGVKFPHEMVLVNGPQKIKLTATDIKVNSGVKDEEFSN